MFLRNFGLWVKSRNSERRSGSRELACFHCRLLRLGRTCLGAVALRAGASAGGRHGGAMRVERRRPRAEGPRSSRQGLRWWPPRWAARAGAPWSLCRQLRVLHARDLARVGGRAQHDDGGNGEGGGIVGWKSHGAHLLYTWLNQGSKIAPLLGLLK